MDSKKENGNQMNEELFEKFKSVELSPLPYFSQELLSLPDDTMAVLREMADKHNCTVSYVISHALEDFFCVAKDIAEISAESLVQFSKETPYLLIKKDRKAFAKIAFYADGEKRKKNARAKDEPLT